MNRDLVETVNLVDHFPLGIKGDFSNLAKQALRERPELKVLGEQSTALEKQAASTDAGLWPQLNISGGYQYQQNKFQVYENMWMANATVSWKIYDGSTRHQSGRLKYRAQALISQRNDLKNTIQLQVRSAWLSLQETFKRIDISQQAIIQSDENLKVSTERYQQGLANHTEVLDAENLRIKTYDNFNNARYDNILANLLLRRAIGIL
jgi:outer membrane protein TolC